MIDLEKIRAFIKRNVWVEAKTYAKTYPHEYVVCYGLPNCEQERKSMVHFAKYIRREGYTAKFWSKTFHSINIDGYKYWTMDDDVEKTDLVNRELIKDET